MAKLQLNAAVLTLLAIGGCSQIIGLSDYEIDKELDGAGGEAVGGDGSGGSTAGSKSEGGDGPVDRGGEGPIDRGGETSQGGEVNGGGTPSTAGQPGVGGEGGSAPVPIDCDSEECCNDEDGVVVQVGGELLPNGDFEAKRSSWYGYYDSSDTLDVFTENDPVEAHSGDWYVWLGGTVDDAAELQSPTFTVPEGASWLRMAGFRFFAFDSLALDGDAAAIALYPASGTDAVEVFSFWDNYEYDNDRWEEFVGSHVPAEAYVGDEYFVSIVAVTDALYDVDPPPDPEDPDPPVEQKASNFFFDDLSLTAYRCVSK
jgi:hypothetical protein